MFLKHTDDAPEVRQMFKAQLEQREKPKIKEAQKFQNETIESTNEPVTKTKKTRTRTRTKSLWD